MALLDILEKINKETELKLAQLEKDFNEKIQGIEVEFEKKQKSIDENIHKSIEEKSKSMMEKAKNLATREAENDILKAKRELIDECIEETIVQLSDSSDYEEILTTLILKSNMEDDAELIPAKGKEEQTKKALKKSEKNYKLSDKTANIKGGFILKTKKIEIDNSFETILKKQFREDIEMNINKILFS